MGMQWYSYIIMKANYPCYMSPLVSMSLTWQDRINDHELVHRALLFETDTSTVLYPRPLPICAELAEAKSTSGSVCATVNAST